MAKKAKESTKRENSQNFEESIFLRNIQRGIDVGFIKLNEDSSRITYMCSREYTTSFKNPEEKVRGSYFAELVIDYQYPIGLVDFEVTVPRRTPSDLADIVVYEDKEKKVPFLVVECKRDGVTDAEFKQAIEQAFGNANSLRAKYASVVAGTTKTAFDVAGFKPSERDRNVIADIPIKFGKAPKYRFYKGDKSRDLKIVSRDELIKALEKCHDTVWQGGKLAPTTAFDEVSKLLFCKLKDEKNTTKNDKYTFQIGTNESIEEVSKNIQAIYLEAKKEDSEVFKEDIRLEDKIIYNVVEHLQGLAINKIDLDTKGIAFEKFMGDFFKGKMGQFFTPRTVVEFCVNMLDPQKSDKVLDPSCGSGGFLLNAMDHVRKFAESKYDELEAERHWHKFAENNLFGIEINDQIARVCKMNMIIHDDGHTNVISADALQSIKELTKHNKGFDENKFDLILTNPPFGATVKDTEKDYLPSYDLGIGKKNQKTEILFIERCIDFLKPETGIIGVVLPDSIAINSSLQYVRDYIMEKTQVLSIVSLPDIAFVHYGANVKSSLFFLRKLGSKETMKNYPILMCIADKVGYTATGKDDDSDLPLICSYFHKFRNGNTTINPKHEDNIFIINASEVMGRRMDPKGYTKKFKELKQQIANSKKKKARLSELLIKNVSGEWGLDPTIEELPSDYELCYVLRNTNFHNNFNLDLSDVAIRYIEKRKIPELQLKKNDILVEKSGGSPVQPVGRVALIDELPDDKPVVFSNFLSKIVVNEKLINPVYVYSYLKTLYHKKYMEYIQNQTTGIKNLLMSEFNEIEVLIPSIDEQVKIIKAYYNSILETKEKIDRAYKELEESREKVEKLILA